MTTRPETTQSVRDEDAVWPLPPLCGVLGAAYTWFVQPDPVSAPAAGRLVRRQLALWRVGATTSGLVALAVEELVAAAVEHSAPPLMLEVARRPGHIAIAVRSASPVRKPLVAAHYIEQHGLTLAEALVEDLFITAVPGDSGSAVVVHVADRPDEPQPDADTPATGSASAPEEVCPALGRQPAESTHHS
ncbi:ATP-binding protein [Streptomyces sp. NPDC012935]|uniref:ATP-binding protein n=1 Tax=Streptomyces sp. NPDC012935 TaxID=3364857 RepID=UPI003674EFF1